MEARRTDGSSVGPGGERRSTRPTECLRDHGHTHYYRDTLLTEFKSKHISSFLTLSREDKLCKPED